MVASNPCKKLEKLNMWKARHRYHLYHLGAPCAPSQLLGDTWDIRIFVKWGLLPNHQAGPARFACTALKFSKKRRTNFITRTRAGRWFRPPSCLNQTRERLLCWAWLSAAFTTLAQPLMTKSSPQTFYLIKRASYMHSTQKAPSSAHHVLKAFCHPHWDENPQVAPMLQGRHLNHQPVMAILVPGARTHSETGARRAQGSAHYPRVERLC